MRKFNKRILSLFLSTAMLVSLAACNKTKGDEKKSGKEGKTEQKSAFRLETLKLQGGTRKNRHTYPGAVGCIIFGNAMVCFSAT